MANKGVSEFEKKTKVQNKAGVYTGGRSTGSSNSSSSRRNGSDDFSRRGIGDKVDVTGQRKRGRKAKGEEQYRKNKKRKK